VAQHSDIPHELQLQTRPDFEAGTRIVRSADLFSGCGGLSLGVAQACLGLETALDVRLAVDFNADASKVFETNFPKAHVVNDEIEKIITGNFGESFSQKERQAKEDVGELDLLVAGPPCQGHSDLNNHTRRADPKNLLYLRVARAAEVLDPAIVFIENVPTVKHDKNHVVDRSRAQLEGIGFDVASAVLRLHDLGIPQNRRRHVLLAIKPSLGVQSSDVLAALTGPADEEERDLKWAIGDLAQIESGTGIDLPPRATATNRTRMEWLLSHNEYDLPNEYRPKCHQNDDHTYRSMYGRLRWDLPAQTITSGFGSIGQGRYMHPDKPRALTPHEAARIQGFPDYFQFAPVSGRGSLAMMIANAVPPGLARHTFARILPALWGEELGESMTIPGHRLF
jgi:DNA (cytosine-5)-methyltransferase 1